jgi:hypothetical protein
MSVENSEANDFCYLDQIQSADYTLAVISTMHHLIAGRQGLKAVAETDIYRLRRGLCLPCASSSCINKVKGFRLIGDTDGPIRVGDIYRTLLPFHGRSEFEESAELLSKGWLFTTDQGDVYHHAIVAFSEAVGVPAMSVGNFRSVKDFEELLAAGGAAAISLDNRFVIEHTLGKDENLVISDNGSWKILIDGPGGLEHRKFENGRHVVAVLGISFDDVLILDSFRLPQMSSSRLIFKLPVKEVDKYLNYRTGGVSRGILFAKDDAMLSHWEHLSNDLVVPKSVVERVRKNLVI